MIPGGQHHDFVELPDGNLLVASDSPDLSTVEDYVVEIDRETGAVVWELDMKDLISQEDGQSASMDSDREVRKLTGSIIMVLPMMQRMIWFFFLQDTKMPL